MAEDRRAALGLVAADALEDAGPVVQAVAEHVDLRLVPGDELAVVPDQLSLLHAGKYAEIGARSAECCGGCAADMPVPALIPRRQITERSITAAVISAVPTTCSPPAPVARSGVRRPRSRTASTAASIRAASLGLAEAVAEHHRRREEGGERVGARPGRRCRAPSRGPARTARGRHPPEAGRGQHPQRPGQHRRLVAEDVAEEVLGDDHVEVGGARDELHRRVVDQQVVELDVGVARRRPGSPSRARGARSRARSPCRPR